MAYGRKKKISLLAAVIACLVLAVPLLSCSRIEKAKAAITNRFTSEKELDSALAAAENFLEAVMEKDYPTAYELISNQDKRGKSYQDFEQEFRNVTEIVSFKMNWVEVKNNIAVVSIDFVDIYDGTEKIYKDKKISLVKEEEGGSWKINFWP